MAFYSSNGVDQFLTEHIEESFGYACDVGANDGKFFSNTLHFEERGWMVLCVEPNPLLEAQGRESRRLWRNVAAGATDGEADFVACGGPPYASSSSINTGAKHLEGQVFKVPMLRLDRMLEEAGFPRLDYLTVDVESYEPEVMKGFTIERWKPKIIVIESWEDNYPVPDGYTRIDRREYDNVYKRNE